MKVLVTDDVRETAVGMTGLTGRRLDDKQQICPVYEVRLPRGSIIHLSSLEKGRSQIYYGLHGRAFIKVDNGELTFERGDMLAVPQDSRTHWLVEEDIRLLAIYPEIDQYSPPLSCIYCPMTSRSADDDENTYLAQKDNFNVCLQTRSIDPLTKVSDYHNMPSLVYFTRGKGFVRWTDDGIVKEHSHTYNPIMHGGTVFVTSEPREEFAIANDFWEAEYLCITGVPTLNMLTEQ